MEKRETHGDMIQWQDGGLHVVMYLGAPIEKTPFKNRVRFVSDAKLWIDSRRDDVGRSRTNTCNLLAPTVGQSYFRLDVILC